MPRFVTNGLTKTKVEHLKAAGRYNDGRGLYLVVSEQQGRSWVLRYMRQGRQHEIGLGSARDLGLDAARTRAATLRMAIRDGADPAVERRVARAERATFQQCAETYIAENEATWRNEKHRQQWRNTLATYVYPVIGDVAVANISTPDVLKIVDPIWATKNETAARVIGRIATILDWAKARGHRTGDNPAQWKGHLDKSLPARKRVAKVEHFASLPHADLPAFMEKLGGQAAVSARALEFLILTAARSGEVIGARWDEIDLASGTWTIPGERMKAGREHRVPLPAPALELLRNLNAARVGNFIFPGAKLASPMSNMTMAALLERMGRSDITPHGFRSTFRVWVAEATNYPGAVAEAALAHTIKDKVERAYQRSDLFENRRSMMADWATFAMSGR